MSSTSDTPRKRRRRHGRGKECWLNWPDPAERDLLGRADAMHRTTREEESSE
jgi:hypothetical protein